VSVFYKRTDIVVDIAVGDLLQESGLIFSSREKEIIKFLSEYRSAYATIFCASLSNNGKEEEELPAASVMVYTSVSGRNEANTG